MRVQGFASLPRPETKVRVCAWVMKQQVSRKAKVNAKRIDEFRCGICSPLWMIADNQNLVADFVEAASKFAASVLLAIDRRDRAGGLGSSVVVTGYRVVPACLEST